MPTSVMAQDLLWGEEVVPALRKRLQSESKTLARRLSAISLPSGDEGRSPSKVLNPQKHHLAQVQTQEQQQQQFQAVQAKAQRQRTYSSPKHPHPTRIPKARQMSGSSILGSRQTPSQSAENTPKPRQPPTPSSSSSRSTFDLPRSHTRGLGLLHESPPFPIDSVSSSSSTGGGLYTQAHAHGRLSQTQAPKQVEEDPPRPSIDSEERPYEHWYRGEVSRNGGVGELKVGRRKEMLDIANYGHFIRSRKAGNGVGVGAGAAGRENNYLDMLQLRKTRPRAGSIGGLTRKERDSLYLDEMDQEGIVGESGWRGVGGLWTERVLDQDPPTDFDKDDDDDDDDVEEEAEEEAEEGVEENGIEPTRREDSHNDVPHNLNHNYQEEDDDFVLVDHDPQQIASDTQPYPYAYAYIPTESDVVDSSTMAANAIVNINGSSDTNAATRWTSTAGAHQTQQTATYPTNSTTPVTRPSSRQTSPPSRIPHPSSSSRCSSDSRSTHNSASTITPTHATPTQIPPRPARSKSEPPTSLAVASASPSTFNSISIPQGTSPPSAFNMRNTSPGSTSASSSPSPSQLQSPSSTKKTPSSNTTNLRMKPNSRPKAKQKSKSKPPPTKREERSDKRSSVAMYPTVEGGEELADAIPSWMQPVTREGNWDDVVLPVVARKKGLEGYFENTNPHLQQKKRQINGVDIVAPAPGTFGYDHSKYRHPLVGDDADGDEFVELDEFGVSKPPLPLAETETKADPSHKQQEEERDMHVLSKPNPTEHTMQVQGQVQMSKKWIEEKEHARDLDASTGCCKCIVM